jgi:hypothetical protein
MTTMIECHYLNFPLEDLPGMLLDIEKSEGAKGP